MVVTYIHLSDIHFGQERLGSALKVNDDVKDQLVRDVQEMVKTIPGGCVQGIIISGDIAQAAKDEEYQSANIWLEKLVQVAGCPVKAIQVVPGNHDVDRSAARGSYFVQAALTAILEKGEVELDKLLEKPADRETFYARFQGYRRFADAYGCPLDADGGNAGVREVEIAPNRTLRFVGLNTALVCGAQDDEEGKLLLGARQHVINAEDGKETVLIAHHPLRWLQDSEQAGKYIRARARVMITGHEHQPSARVERVGTGAEVLMLAAGATVPPNNKDGYTYTYNFLQFSWDEPTDGLQVKVIPRVWSDDSKAFCEDTSRSTEADSTFKLGCPNFARGARVVLHTGESAPTAAPVVRELLPESMLGSQRGVDMKAVTEQYAKLRLQFFRDLNAAGRIEVLVKLGALPPDWQDALAHPIESRALEKLLTEGRLQDLEQAIEQVKTKKT